MDPQSREPIPDAVGLRRSHHDHRPTLRENIKSIKLRDLVFGSGRGSLPSRGQFFQPYFPGPLEGTGTSPNPLPAELLEAIEAQLRAREAHVSSFIALVNTAHVFRVEPQQAESAANLIKSSNYRVSGVGDSSQLLYVLDGLAKVAAVTRSHSLADELRILLRRYWRGDLLSPSIEDTVRVCLVAAASRENLNEWREFTGDWLTELAFGDLGNDEGHLLHHCLQYLCHAVPELWVSCGRADAALEAFSAA